MIFAVLTFRFGLCNCARDVSEKLVTRHGLGSERLKNVVVAFLVFSFSPTLVEVSFDNLAVILSI